MLSDLSLVIKALDTPNPPDVIWQKPLDNNSDHYARLCNLNGKSPQSGDLVNYALDIWNDSNPLQTDLFRYLLPICLGAWRENLLGTANHYDLFVEWFWAALGKPSVLPHLSLGQYEAIETFISQALLDRMDQEDRLCFTDNIVHPYQWIDTLGSFCIVFSSLSALWEQWWAMATSGRAGAALQYVSLLLYEDDRNPIFPVIPERGAMIPFIWEREGYLDQYVWRRANVDWLKTALTVEFVEGRLHIASQVLKGAIQSGVPEQMLADFAVQRTLLEKRLAELPVLLLQPVDSTGGWSV